MTQVKKRGKGEPLQFVVDPQLLLTTYPHHFAGCPPVLCDLTMRVSTEFIKRDRDRDIHIGVLK